MKKAFLLMLFVFSVTIAGCGDKKEDIPPNPDGDEAIGEMEAQADPTEDPGEGGEGENSSDG